MPKVSVIIPTYNRAKFLEEAINSVLEQTFQDFEIVVVDDGSTDNTEELISAYDTDKLRYVFQENKGAAAARNRGIRSAKGELLAFLDSDDKYLPQKLEKQVAYLDQYPSVGMVYHDYVVYNAHADAMIPSPGTLLLNGRVFRELMLECMKGPLVTPSVMVRKEVFSKVEPFDETMHLAEDIDLWCRISRYYEIGSLQERLCWVRYHAGKTSGDTDPVINLSCWTKILHKAFRVSDDQVDWQFKRKLYAKTYLITWRALMYKKRVWLAQKYLVLGLFNWPYQRGVNKQLKYLLWPASGYKNRLSNWGSSGFAKLKTVMQWVLPTPVYRWLRSLRYHQKVCK